MGRGQMVTGVALFGGSVAGGLIAQATSLGVLFLLRVGVLAVIFVVAHLRVPETRFGRRNIAPRYSWMSLPSTSRRRIRFESDDGC